MQRNSHAFLRTLTGAVAGAAAALLLGVFSRAEATEYSLKSGVYNRLGNSPHSNVVESSGFSGPVSTSSYPSGGNFTLTRSSIGTTFASGVPRYQIGSRITPPTAIYKPDGTLLKMVDASYWRSSPLCAADSATYSAPVNYRDGTTITIPSSSTVPSFQYSLSADAVFATTPGTVSLTWVSAAVDAAASGGGNLFYTETFAVSSTSAVPVRKIYWTDAAVDGTAASGTPVVISVGQIQQVNVYYTSAFPAKYGSSTTANTLWPVVSGSSIYLHAANLRGRMVVEYLGAVLVSSTGKREFLGLDVVDVESTLLPVQHNVELGAEISAFDGTSEIPYDPAKAGAGTNLVASPSADTLGSYYGTSSRPDNTSVYYAERANEIPENVAFYWLEPLTIGQAATVTASGVVAVTKGSTAVSMTNTTGLAVGQLVSGTGIAAGTTVTALVANTSITLSAAATASAISIAYHPLGSNGPSAVVNSRIQWPKLLNHYTLRWPTDITRFANYTLEGAGSSAVTGTGVQFPGGKIPTVIYQEPSDVASGASGTVSTVEFNNTSQRLFVDLTRETDSLNRALLKFTGTNGALWYVPLLTQGMDRSGFLEGDGAAPATGTVYVGERLAPPSSDYTLAAYVLRGDCYAPQAYINPFVAGVPAAEKGAVIPVNALPGGPALSGCQTYLGNKVVACSSTAGLAVGMPVEGSGIPSGAVITSINSGVSFTMSAAATATNLTSVVANTTSLTVWWFKKIQNTSASAAQFSEFYLPAKVGHYQVAYREEVATTDNFDDAPSTGWSDGRTLLVTPPAASGLLSGNVLGPFSNYMVSGAANTAQNGPATSKTFLPGSQGAAGVSFTFLLHRIDTWANNSFRAYVQGVAAYSFSQVLSYTFANTDEVTAASSSSSAVVVDGVSYSWTVAPVAGSYGNFVEQTDAQRSGAPSSVSDQILSVTLTATPLTPAGGESLAALSLGFGSDLASGAGAFAVDDVTLTLGAPSIVLASNLGSGNLTDSRATGSVYNQAVAGMVGYNPNEEHALLLEGRLYALRDDLNVTSGAGFGSFTSLPRALLLYTDPVDQRPAMAVYKVVRENDLYRFNYPVAAGTLVNAVAPMPLPLLALPLDSSGVSKNTEVNLSGIYPETAPQSGTPAAYSAFLYKDRKGNDWVYRGPHVAGDAPGFGMQFYYEMQENFAVPGLPTLAAGTILPYLRPLDESGAFVGDKVAGEALTVVYRPSWPASVPTLNVGETLTLAKNGLPGVRGQTSAQVLYQQSMAVNGTATPSVVLVDPTRSKSVLLDDSRVGLSAHTDRTPLPVSLKTTVSDGKTYFQLAQPHLQQRFYFDPQLGTIGGLVLLGQFVDVVAGEDYLLLNTLSPDDKTALEGLVSGSDAEAAKWLHAIEALSTTVQTFVADPARPGSFIPGSATRVPEHSARVLVNGSVVNYSFSTQGSTASVVTPADSLPQIGDSNTAVDSYALSAPGKGAGYVTLIFGDGTAFTPQGEPVTMQVVRVIDRLYQGDLKAIFAANPLDEQTTLRHSGDFAAHPESYEFQWRYAFPSEAVPIPAVYSYSVQSAIGGASANAWKIQGIPLANPSTESISTAAYTGDAYALPRSIGINDAGYSRASGLPGKLLLNTTGIYCAGSVPGQIVFSTNLAESDGCVVYVNGVPALAYNVPVDITVPGGLSNTGAGVGLVAADDALARQFELSPSFFSTYTTNRIEVALYSLSDAGILAAGVDFRIHVLAKADIVTADAGWESPSSEVAAKLTNTVVIGGSAGSQLGGSTLIFKDAFFTMRYRPTSAAGLVVGDTVWSEWTEPVFVPSWVKRVLDGINPFNQRTTDLSNTPISTDVNVLTQAGRRWEGDVALNLSSINSFGLIEIYETVLNRLKAQSIDAGILDPEVNTTLLLVAGYLNDLYMLLGNEAADDAINPTLQIDGQSGPEQVPSARFSFEGQVSTLLDETLALWRGRDDFGTNTQIAPAYNRLYWNYTNGVRSGEPIYAVNYNIKEKSGVGANGVVDAADAQTLYPQGHGDAYGHYLTALTGYYKLLTSGSFTWVPTTETVSVLGQSVAVDYKDERRFAAAAAALANAGYQTLSLTGRQQFDDSEAAGWTAFTEAKANSTRGTTRYWGTDEWAGRAAQGAYFNWVSVTALLPVPDTNPLTAKEGIAKVDRTTVTELQELATTAANISTLSAQLQAHLNPLGLASDAMTFDISSTQIIAGKTHFEQIYDRAVSASLNAKAAFMRACEMNGLLRTQANSTDDYSYAITQQETAYQYQLLDIFGSPYPGDVGPGKTYVQGYTGPDIYNFLTIDKPFALDQTGGVIDSSQNVVVTLRQPVNAEPFSGEFSLEEVYNRLHKPKQFALRTFTISGFGLARFATSDLGRRQQVGRIQSALLDSYLAQIRVLESRKAISNLQERFDRDYQAYSEITANFGEALAERTRKIGDAKDLMQASIVQAFKADQRALSAEFLRQFGETAGEFDPLLPENATQRLYFIAGAAGADGGAADARRFAAEFAEKADLLREDASYLSEDAKIDAENRLRVAEFERLFHEVQTAAFDLAARVGELQQTKDNITRITAEATRILSERETFRIRSAGVIQGYRTRDVVYRDLRNEQLSQYNALFNLAQTYTYCAAKAYDYETGLLNSDKGAAFIKGVISNLSLGAFDESNPVSTKLGDPGLAGVLAALRDDWEVARRRLGFNNPDRNGTLFSLRQELFRLRTDQATTEDNALWTQVLQQHVMSNLLNDSDVVAQCSSIANPDGSAVPGFVIPFSTTIQPRLNFFGWPLAGGDHNFSRSAFATKILSAGVVFKGYVGMDAFDGSASPASSSANVLGATPYIYLIPVGRDFMRTPALGDAGSIRSWQVKDQALPLPINIGGNAYSALALFTPQGTLNEQLWIPRKHQAFRAVDDAQAFYGSVPAEFTNSRLVGRSVWNSEWKLVIPASSLLYDEQDGINRFINSVSDIKLFLRTYSNSGN